MFHLLVLFMKPAVNFQTLIVGEGYPTEGVSSATAALMSQTPPPHFCSMVVRLIAQQILNIQVMVS